MSDFRERLKREYAEKLERLRANVTPVVAHLEGFTMDPDDTDGDGLAVGYLTASGNGLKLKFSREWNKPDRVRVAQIARASYVDADGVTRYPTHDRVGAHCAKTSYADGRDPAQAAKQVARRVIEPEQKAMEELAQFCEQATAEAAREANARKLLNAACREKKEPTEKPYFVRDMPGGSVRLEYRGRHHVSIGWLQAEEAASCIEFLRALREVDA